MTARKHRAGLLHLYCCGLMAKIRAKKISAWILTILFVSFCSYLDCCVKNAEPKTRLETGFSPAGSSLDIILKGVGDSKESILVAAYSFTSQPIAKALVEAHKRGVKVQVIADKKSNSGKYSAVTFLANQGVPVRLNGNYQIFHHKFMVFDGLHVETGSFNYSAAAVNKNAENVVMIRGNKAVAHEYTLQWQKLWDESVEVKPNY